MPTSASADSLIHVHCQGFLFDMDGILISSIASVERSWSKWATMRGVDPALACRTAHGCRAIETVAKLRPDLDSEAELRVIEEIELSDGDGIIVLPGVLDLLSQLPPNRWTVVTSATDKIARMRLAVRQIPLPDKLVTAESVPQGKPDPAPYLKGAELLGLDPAQCVVFEDAPSGTKAGRAAGATVIATPFSHAPAELEAAHYLVNDLSQIQIDRAADGGFDLHFKPLV